MARKVPVEKIEKILPNGMKVVLLVKKDYVRSLFLIGIPAGGRNIAEKNPETGEVICHPSGCAHYLEHQNFRLNGEDVTPKLASLQAQTNAFTSYMETCYYITTGQDPRPALGVLMDFVQTLDISDETVEKERGIILSELHIDQNQPESRMFHELFKSMYSNSYLKEDILGSEQDIKKISAADLQAFYSQFYDPGRLVLVGVTGRDPEEIMEFIEKREENYPSRLDVKAVPEKTEELKELARTDFSMNLDVYMPYQAVGVKLDPADNILDALKKDYMINLWLDAVMGAMNPDYQSWIDQRIITQNSGAESDTTPDYSYIMFYSQTQKPEEYLQLVTRVLDEKPKVTEDVFEALRIQNKASALRSYDNFESMALDQVRGTFQHYDPFSIPEMNEKVSLQELNDYIQSLDFSRRTTVEIHPLEQTEEFEDEPSDSDHGTEDKE